MFLNEVHKVVELIRKEEMLNDAEAVTQPSLLDVSWREDVELIRIACCKTVTISSKTKTKQMYPSILGTYTLLEGEDRELLYQKSPHYLSRPASGHVWGVSTVPRGGWGYIRSAKAAPCPDMAHSWMVYDDKARRWFRDRSLSVSCTHGSAISAVVL